MVVAALAALAVSVTVVLGGCSGDAEGPPSPILLSPAGTPASAAPTTVASTAPGRGPDTGHQAPDPDTGHLPPEPPRIELADDRFSPEQRLVIDAYRAAWDAEMAASAAPAADPDHPDLAARFVGAALDQVRAGLADKRELGRATRHAEPSEFAIYANSVRVDGDVAHLEVCLIDDAVVFDPVTDVIENDWRAVLNRRVQLARIDGSWRVQFEAGIHSTRDPEATCG